MGAQLLSAGALALLSAACFGAMTVALRLPLGRGAAAEAGALFTVVIALAVALFAALDGGVDTADLDALAPFLLAGALGPGCSQVLFTLAVRDAGPSRASVVVGTAPLFSVAIAFTVLDEPVTAGIVVGALLIVGGGIALMGERRRPSGFRATGVAFAIGAALAFSTRDNLVRAVSVDTDVDPALAAGATLASGAATILVYLLAARRPIEVGAARLYAPAGLLFGVSYVTLFTAFDRGPVSVVSPLVATESLFAVSLSALVLGASELVGRRLALGAVLVATGAALIGASG